MVPILVRPPAEIIQPNLLVGARDHRRSVAQLKATRQGRDLIPECAEPVLQRANKLLVV